MQLQPTEEMLTLIGGLIVAYFVYVLITRKNDKPSTDPPAMAHAALREIVERAVEEARKLPELGASTDIKLSREERTIADRSYEELLATAILNKVIERFQRERVDGNSNVVHDVDLRNVRYTSTENKYGLEKDASFRLECNNDHDTSNKLNGDHQEPVSFMMEERVEEVTTITSDDEVQDTDVFESGRTRRVPFPEFGMDIVDPPRELPSPSPPSLSDSSDSNHNRQLRVRTKPHSAGCTMDLISPIESWEDNWLFQKRKTTRSQPDAVAMLVPSSNTYYKALIGDKDAEDTSDLSECSSTRSDEEIEKELMDAINNVIPRSPRFSECDIESNREMPNDVTEFEKDEVDICQTKIRNNEVFSEYFDERNGKKFLQVSEEIIIKDEDDKEERNESATALVKRREKEDKVKEKFEDRIERDEKITISAMESSPQKNTKVHAQFEKSNERDDRENATNDEQQDEEQRESEYTEHYDTAIQRHLDSLTKIDVCSGKNEVADEMEKLTGKLHEGVENYLIEKLKRESSEVQLSHATIDIMVESDRLSSPPRPGTIAEREHKKWENAPPIENNPYSEESIRRRSWERRYSRKATNIPGSHYEVTKLDEVNVEALLTPDLPDIKRFGRDYYINQSKMAIGERSEQDRSSRPSSSLSQRSSCAGDEQRERQVSHELERFEGDLLHGSLARRCYRDPCTSPHFVINPLIRLKLARSGVCDLSWHQDHHEFISERYNEERIENLVENKVQMMDRQEREHTIEDTTGSQQSRDSARSDMQTLFRKNSRVCVLNNSTVEENHVLAESLENDMDFQKVVSMDWDRFWDNCDYEVKNLTISEQPIIPRYEDRREKSPNDRDSGIGSRNSEISSEKNRWRRLYRIEDNDCHGGEHQISSISGRRFWTTGYKYYTYGGIKIRPKKVAEELEDDMGYESIYLEDRLTDCIPEFAKLKFQTFGGIKRYNEIDGKKIPNYKRIRLRQILPETIIPVEKKNNYAEVWTEKPVGPDYPSIGWARFEDITNLDRPTNLGCRKCSKEFAGHQRSILPVTSEESNWQNEKDDLANERVAAENTQNGHSTSKNRMIGIKINPRIRSRNSIRRKNLNSSFTDYLPSINDNLQKDGDCVSEEIITNNFLKEVPARRATYPFSDGGVSTKRGKKISRSRKYRKILKEESDKRSKKLMTRNIEWSSGSSKKRQRTQEGMNN